MELSELAQNYFGNTRSGSLAGPIGAFLTAVLVVFTVLLIRNMNARLRRLPERFPDPPGGAGPGSGGGAGPVAGRGTGPGAVPGPGSPTRGDSMPDAGP